MDGRRAGLGLARAAGRRARRWAQAQPDGGGVGRRGACRRGRWPVGGAGRTDPGEGRLAPALVRETQAKRAGRRQHRPGPLQGCGAGPLRPGRRGDQDVSHRRQRGLPAQGGAVQGPAGPAAEIGLRLLRQARRAAGQGDGRGLASGAGGVELRAGRADRQGREPGGCPGGAPRRAGGPGGAGGRAGGRRRGDGGRRPEPDRGRRAAGSDGEDGRGDGDVPAVGVAAGRPGGDRRGGAGGAGGLPVAAGLPPVEDGPDRRGADSLPAGAGRPGGAGRRPRGPGRGPSRPGGHGQPDRHPAEGYGPSGGGGGRVPPGDGDLRRSWPPTTPPSPNSASDWRAATTTSASCCRRRAGRRRRRPSSAGRRRSTRSWPPTTPPSPNSAAPGEQPHQPRPPADGDGQADGGGGRVPPGAGDLREAGRRQPRRHRVPQPTGDQPRQPRPPAVDRRAS